MIGKGNIGGSLGSKWTAAGHDVVYGARDTSGEGPGGAPIQSIGAAIEQADVVALAVPGKVVGDVVAEHGAALAGKTVVDAVNRIGAPEFDSRAIIAQAAPQARYVRAFNSLGWENFANPMPGTDLFFAADPDARATAEELIRAVGLEPAYVGDAGVRKFFETSNPWALKSIAERIGVRHAEYLSVLFKRAVGVPPGAYRRKH